MKRPTANVSGDNSGDSAPVADNDCCRAMHHLGVVPPQIPSSNRLLWHLTWTTLLFWPARTRVAHIEIKASGIAVNVVIMRIFHADESIRKRAYIGLI